MENVQFIVANLKTFDDNDSTVNTISNVQMINLTFQRQKRIQPVNSTKVAAS